MHVTVNFFERHINEQERHRVNAVRQNRAIAFRQRAANQTVAHESSIHEKKLRIA